MTRHDPGTCERSDRGSAAVDFTLVAPLVILTCAAVAQVAVWTADRAGARAAAFDGARAGAVAPGPAAQRLAVARRAARGAGADVVDARAERVDGVPAISVEVTLHPALLGWDLPLQQTVVEHVPTEPG